MQASKIIPGTSYAIYNDHNELVEFLVTSVTTTRFKGTGNPHDYRSAVQGFLDGERDAEGSRIERTLQPKEILGPVNDYRALIAKREEEKAARAAVEAARTAEIANLWSLLHSKMGLPPKSNDPRSYNQDIRATSSGIDVYGDAVKALTDYLNSH